MYAKEREFILCFSALLCTSCSNGTAMLIVIYVPIMSDVLLLFSKSETKHSAPSAQSQEKHITHKKKRSMCKQEDLNLRGCKNLIFKTMFKNHSKFQLSSSNHTT